MSATPLDRLLAKRANEQPSLNPTGVSLLADVVTRLQLPASLLGGRQIAIRAIQLLRTSVPVLRLADRPIVLKYIEELQWLLRFTYRFHADIFKDKKNYDGFCEGGNPYERSGAHDHGLCCLLMASCDKADPDFVQRQLHFDVLGTIAIQAHMAALGHWGYQADWSSPDGPGARIRESMYRRTLAIRHFVMDPYRANAAYREALLDIPLHRSSAQLRTTLREIRRGLPAYAAKPEAQLDPDLASILGLLRVAENPTSIRSYESDEDEDPHPAKKKATRREIKCCTDDDDNAEDAQDEEEEEASAQTVTYERTLRSEKQEAECVEAGLNPAEAFPAQRFHLSTRRSGDPRAGIAMGNQNLSLDMRILATQQLGIALQILESLVPRNESYLELFALVKTVVARGSTFETAQALEVRSDPPGKVERLTFWLSPREDTPSEWLIPAVPIPYATEQGSYEGCRNVVKSFPSPDYWRVGPLLRRLIEIKYPTWNGEPIYPFKVPIKLKGQPSTFSKRLKAALEHGDPDRGPGLGHCAIFSRLGRVLPQRIYNQTGDLVPVTYATLRKEPTGEDGRFYATPSVLSVQQAELRAVRSINDEFFLMGYDASMDLDLIPSDSSGYLGSPMCATFDALERFVQQLLLRIAKANKILKQRTGDIDATIDRHNAFVMLTFCVVSIGTCHRPTHGTVPDLGSIDSSTGLFSTVDKGPSSARLAVCADAAVAQCQGWLTYRNNFDFEKHFGANPNSGLFFIDANHEFVAVSVSSLKDQSFPFVANFARHLAKTVLSEWCDAGGGQLSQEFIAALLAQLPRLCAFKNYFE